VTRKDDAEVSHAETSGVNPHAITERLWKPYGAAGRCRDTPLGTAASSWGSDGAHR